MAVVWQSWSTLFASLKLKQAQLSLRLADKSFLITREVGGCWLFLTENWISKIFIWLTSLAPAGAKWPKDNLWINTQKFCYLFLLAFWLFPCWSCVLFKKSFEGNLTSRLIFIDFWIIWVFLEIKKDKMLISEKNTATNKSVYKTDPPTPKNDWPDCQIQIVFTISKGVIDIFHNFQMLKDFKNPCKSQHIWVTLFYLSFSPGLHTFLYPFQLFWSTSWLKRKKCIK